MYFLSDKRRRRLIADLEGLSMPTSLAITCAAIPNCLVAVDRLMSVVITKMVVRCERLDRAKRQRDDAQCRNLEAYVAAASITLAHVLSEIRERGLPREQFGRLDLALKDGLHSTRLARELILNEMGEGRLQ